MAALLIKSMPAELHERLRQQATAHHRSMNREVIAILERELSTDAGPSLPPAVKLKKPVDPDWIVDIIRKAREPSA